MGWNLNSVMSAVNEILGDRFAAFSIGVDSYSSVRIVHSDKITIEEETKITNLFPMWVRVEFCPR